VAVSFGQIISVCNSDRIIKMGQCLQKLCSNEKKPSLFDSQCTVGSAFYSQQSVRMQIIFSYHKNWKTCYKFLPIC